MRTVGTAELKANLAAYLTAVRGGEVIVVLRRGIPVARIEPIDTITTANGLVIRPGVGSIHDIPLPGPLDSGGDILDDLWVERADRF